MSNIRMGILGAVAVTLSLGAAHFAFGEDLTVGMRTSGIPEQAIDRGGKTDRAPLLAEPVAPTQTISIHVDRVPGTSVLVRIPVARDEEGGKDQGRATQGAANPSAANPGAAPEGNAAPAAQQLKDQRRTVACEPVVSVLTEIAKHLQPGRCIT
ncbi:MAG TPA: hypothetical protein VK734_07400 [Bradyrhizobium sp.]|jgi:hypothetical protein|nr:hypothetical protein [Bradyrhizobium sp.]